MASLYKKRGIYYLQVRYAGKKKAGSLGTSNIKVARKLKNDKEAELLRSLLGLNTVKKTVTFSQLAELYLNAEHDWKESTRYLNQHVIWGFVKKRELPSNATSRAIWKRIINICLNWGKNCGYFVKNLKKLEGDTRGLIRSRVFNADELKKIINNTQPEYFRLFVKFAYYTGARAGEIRILKKEQVKDTYITVKGKTGERIIRLSNQGKEIVNVMASKNPIAQPYIWNYKKEYVSHKFKQNVDRLCIKDAQFKDIRRTFGYNLIKQGTPIYEVSKLLGHSTVRTTEQYYAPLLVTDVKDFQL